MRARRGITAATGSRVSNTSQQLVEANLLMKHLFRSRYASFRAAAVIILSGGIAAACSSGGEGTGVTAEALTGGSACDGVQLDASRFYRPRSWNDAEVNF